LHLFKLIGVGQQEEPLGGLLRANGFRLGSWLTELVVHLSVRENLNCRRVTFPEESVGEHLAEGWVGFKIFSFGGKLFNAGGGEDGVPDFSRELILDFDGDLLRVSGDVDEVGGLGNQQGTSF
jgi:hypothetical protein